VAEDITVDGPTLTKDHQYHCVATVDPANKFVSNECTDKSDNTELPKAEKEITDPTIIKPVTEAEIFVSTGNPAECGL